MVALRKQFPFPEIDSSIRPLPWAIDSGGRELITELIRERAITRVLEIGSFLGGSAELWLQTSPALSIICVDPWPDADYWAVGDYAAQNGHFEFREQLNAPMGFYKTFLANMVNYRERLIPVRGFSPEALLPLFLAGYSPELVYIDAAKSYDDIAVSHQLWPTAVIGGDDWLWRPEENYPARQAVLRFAAEEGMEVFHRKHTWLLVPKVC